MQFDDKLFFEDVMRRILPPLTNKGKTYHPEITTGTDGSKQDYFAKRKDSDGKYRYHGGVDMNYHYAGQPVGQNGINTKHPQVHSPVDGIVTKVKPELGVVEITDADGFKHRLAHMNTIVMFATNERVTAGEVVGTMGGRGSSGAKEYPQHVHYSLIAPSGKTANPENYWDITTHIDLPSLMAQSAKTPAFHLEFDRHTQTMLDGLEHEFAIRMGETLRRQGDQVWRIEADGGTRGYFISE